MVNDFWGCASSGGVHHVVIYVTSVAESEASIVPLERRFLIPQLTTWVKWHSKPNVHRFLKIKRTIDLSNKRWISPLQKIAEKFKALDLAGLEKIEAFVKAPWVPPVPVHIFDKEEATKDRKIWSRGSLRYCETVLEFLENNRDRRKRGSEGKRDGMG